MADALLSARQLTKRFGGLAAVNGVSVDLWRGQIHAVIGPNGAGKSTLTNLLSGDLPPTSGTVLLGGTDVRVFNRMLVSFEGRYSWSKADLDRDFIDFEPIDLGGLKFGVGFHFVF